MLILNFGLIEDYFCAEKQDLNGIYYRIFNSGLIVLVGKSMIISRLLVLLMLSGLALFHKSLNAAESSSVQKLVKDTSCAPIFQHSMRKLHSAEKLDLCKLTQGKPVLVVNTASHCGFTPQFKGLEELYQRYHAQGLQVIGFASNDFFQESSDEAKTASICYKNYGVSFTMLAPSAVKGDDANPVFKAINAKSQEPGWNFNKYLINTSGDTVEYFGSSTKPTDPELVDAILKQLAGN